MNDATVQVICHPFNWQVLPAEEEGPDCWDQILAWCLDRESNPVLVKICDFPAFCWIELPEIVRGRQVYWQNETAKIIFKAICRKAGQNAPLNYFLKYCQKAYYFQMLKKYPMILVQFSQEASMRKVVNMLKDYKTGEPKPIWTDEFGAIELKAWEYDISSVRKLLSTRNVRYSQWFTITAKEPSPDEKISRLSREYIGDRKTMVPVDEEISKSWITSPLIVSFDIETYSDNYRALPKKHSLKHVSFMISILVKRLGNPNIIRHAIILGDCDPIPGSILHLCETELQVIRKFEDLIIEIDPDILEGYNIFGYDYPYLDARLKRQLENWRSIGRLLNKPTLMYTKVWESRAYGVQSLSILEMDGRISIDLLPIIQRDYKLDKYTLDFVSNKFIGKSKHPVKARDMFMIYELSLDSKKYGTLKLVDYLEIAKTFRNSDFIEMLKKLGENILGNMILKDFALTEMKRVTEYCLQDSVLVLELTEKLNLWIGLIELSNIVGVTPVKLFTAGQQQRVISQLYDLAYHREIVLDKRKNPKIPMGGGSVKLPVRGLHPCVVGYDFSSLYPSIMQAFNLCYTTLVPKELDKVVEDKDCYVIEFDQEEDIKIRENDEPEEEIKLNEVKEQKEEKTEKKMVHYRNKFVKPHVFEGIIPQLVRELVFKRNVVRKIQMKAVQKEKSGYESALQILEAQKFEVYLEEHKDIETNILEDIQTILIMLKQKETFSSDQIQVLKGLRKRLDWIKDSNPEREKQNKELSNKIFLCVLTLIVLDKRQLALKVSANSTFGFLSVQEGVMPLIEAGISITSKGRELIKQVNDFCVVAYPGSEIIYNDTDSCMVDLKIRDTVLAWKEGKKLQDLINGKKDKDGNVIIKGLFEQDVLKMELEKVMIQLCIGKKYYAYVEIPENGSVVLDSVDDIEKKGILISKRGYPKWIVDFYGDLLLHIMKMGNIHDAMKIIVKYAGMLIRKEVTYEDLQIIRGIGANYKSASFYMNIFGQELKKIGKPVEPGSRLEFVIVKTESELLGMRMRSVEDFVEHIESGNPYELDYMYYLEHVALNPIDTLFSIGYAKILGELAQIITPSGIGIGYKPSSRKHFVSISEPIKMISRMIEDGVNIDNIIPWFEVVMKKKEEGGIKIEEVKEVERPKPKLKIISEKQKITKVTIC